LDSFHLFLNLHEIDLHLSGLLGKFVGFPHAVPRLAWEWTNCSSKLHGVHKFITANGNSSILVILIGAKSRKRYEDQVMFSLKCQLCSRHRYPKNNLHC
jgi:hypothetical protein